MNKILIIIMLTLSLGAGSVKAQTYDRILSEIEKNNTSLKALRYRVDAQKLESRKDIHLENPEVEFGYLWGAPAETGNRVDFNVTQNFDFPTTYYYKKKIAESQCSQAELAYMTERRMLLAEARRLCILLTYYNVMQEEYNLHIQTAQTIVDAYQKMYDAGEKGILDLNKAKLNLLSANKEFEANRIEREAVLAQITQLNGGKALSFNDITYPSIMLPSQFDEWYTSVESKNPDLQELDLQQDINKRSLQLSKSLWAPAFSLGYKSERISGTTLQGIGVGISLPLWQNRYAVKSAKAVRVALQEETADVKSQYYTKMKTMYEQTVDLQKLLAEYQEVLSTVNTDELLLKALNMGEIPLVEYIMERNVYHEALHEAFVTERDLHLAYAELMQYAE